MANRIGGCPDKKRLLPGVGYPIPISPAAAPSGGFTSAVALWPFGFGNAAPNPFTLVQSGAVAVSGTLAASGNVGYNKPLTQTGSVGVSGALSATGNITFGQDFPVVAPLDIQAIAGALSVTGNLTISTNPSFVLVQSSAVAVNGALSTTGNLALAWKLQPSGAIAMSGTLATSGNVAFAWRIQPSTLPLAGTVGVTGNLILNNQLTAANNLNLNVSNDININANLQGADVAANSSANIIGFAPIVSSNVSLTAANQLSNVQLVSQAPGGINLVFSAGESAQISANNSVVLASSSAGSDLQLAASGNLSITGPVTAGNTLALNATGDLSSSAVAPATGWCCTTRCPSASRGVAGGRASCRRSAGGFRRTRSGRRYATTGTTTGCSSCPAGRRTRRSCRPCGSRP